MFHPSGKKNPATENNTGDATGQSTSRICGQGGSGTQKERRRVSSRIIEFGLTQRLIQRHGGGQDPIPGRQGVAEGGHSALDNIIAPQGTDFNMDWEDHARPGHPVRTLVVAAVSRRNGNLNPPDAYPKGQMGFFEESGESGRQGPEGGETMNYSDDGTSTDPRHAPNPRPDPAENEGPTGWLYALNSFLERAFLKADVDTGC